MNRTAPCVSTVSTRSSSPGVSAAAVAVALAAAAAGPLEPWWWPMAALGEAMAPGTSVASLVALTMKSRCVLLPAGGWRVGRGRGRRGVQWCDECRGHTHTAQQAAARACLGRRRPASQVVNNETVLLPRSTAIGRHYANAFTRRHQQLLQVCGAGPHPLRYCAHSHRQHRTPIRFKLTCQGNRHLDGDGWQVAVQQACTGREHGLGDNLIACTRHLGRRCSGNMRSRNAGSGRTSVAVHLHGVSLFGESWLC